MKPLIFLLAVIIMFCSCDIRKRERILDAKETELNKKEQELLVREKSIQLKEEELLNREKLIDGASNKNVADTLASLHPNIPAVYNVVMKCTETSCTGSAVGDTKTEQWQITFENNNVIVKATSNNKAVRLYSGNYVGNTIELTAQQEKVATPQAGKIVVRLQETKENKLEGQREIIRPEDCRIVYDIDLQKL